jgi:hypothetical protein
MGIMVGREAALETTLRIQRAAAAALALQE